MFGFLFHDLIQERFRAVDLITRLHSDDVVAHSEVPLFHDAGILDGWFITFIDTHPVYRYSAVSLSPQFSASTAGFLVLLLGTLVATTHASLFAVVSIGCRRYLSHGRGSLLSYYLVPLLPLAVVLASHIQFAYAGKNPNWLQLYVGVVTWPIVAFLLWLSVAIDRGAYVESLQCLGRQRQRAYHPDWLIAQNGATGAEEKTISLIGDSLSTSFYVGWPPAMVFRSWLRWQPNWFLGLEGDGTGSSVLERLSASIAIRGIQHATVSAQVDEGGRRRRLRDRLTDTWHFSHQVDEVLARGLPNVLLIWIGHNNVDWKRAVASTECRSKGVSDLDYLGSVFIRRFGRQLRRILDSVSTSQRRPAPVVLIVLASLISKPFSRLEHMQRS